jgi:two-component system, OmpR family, alkaline phosphatase synthesis response regulator PhoP
MATVHFITRETDTAPFVAGLEASGVTVVPSRPEFLDLTDGDLKAEAGLFDLRGISAATWENLREAYEEIGAAIICLVEADFVGRIPVDLRVDEFVVLPASPEEITLRVNRCLLRKHGIDSENIVHVGDLVIDLSNYRVTVRGESVVLTFKEYELLRFLGMNAGQVFTREQLLNRVWGYDYFGGARTVDVHVRRIRAKIEGQGRRYIETVRNVGYRLLPDGNLLQ